MTKAMPPQDNPIPLATELLRPGMRVTVACSGGADSVALLRTLLDRRDSLGLVLSVAHMNHGIRGEESDGDEAFVEVLASQFGLPFHRKRADTPAIAQSDREGLEEAARKLRYSWLWDLLAANEADAVVTAHTLDDQSETVLHRLLRGAWTEGLGGIHPVLKPARNLSGVILRPFLNTTRREIEAYLTALGQPWREDSTNRDMAYTRNRIRHELLPALAEYNPKVQNQLAQISTLARDEEAYWQVELTRLLPSLLLPGKATRGGGRASDTLFGDQSLSIEIERLRTLHPALRRRVVRAAAAQLGSSIDFDQTERLLAICCFADTSERRTPLSGAKLQMDHGLRVERTPRELKLFRSTTPSTGVSSRKTVSEEYPLSIPGAVDASAFGIRLEVTLGRTLDTPLTDAVLRASRAGDRVTLRHTRSPMKIKDALRRTRPPGTTTEETTSTPVLVWQNEIVWMPEIEIESPKLTVAMLRIKSFPLI